MPLPGSSDRPSPPPPRPPPRGQLSAGLRALADRARVGDLTLGGADDHLQGETAHLLCAIMALPFCQPVPLIGLSTPLGLALAAVALGSIASDRTRLPARLRRLRIPPRFFPHLLRGTGWLVGKAERFLHPRLRWLSAHPWRLVWAIVMAIAAPLLTLPLPVPFSNTFPGVALLLCALGLLERDGFAILAGAVLFILTLGYFPHIGFVCIASWEAWLP